MKKKKTKSQILRTVLYAFVRIESLAMIIYAIIGLVVNFNNREDSRYGFIITQAVCLTALTFLPAIVGKLFKVKLPISMEILYLLFTTSCLLLGEIFEFYILFSWWDDVLHTFSGSFIAVIGFIIIYFLNEKRDVPLHLSPGFIILFCFCFALACECIWETFEFTMDGLVGSNMQRFMDNYDNTILFEGREALADTMGDIIETIIGSSIFCVIAFIDMTCRKKSALKTILRADGAKVIDNNEVVDNNDEVENIEEVKDSETIQE